MNGAVRARGSILVGAVACLMLQAAWVRSVSAGDEAASSVDFVRDVMPVLTKAGCNSGACHGSFQGRGGLRLSLLGFDAQADYEALVKEARGRRIFPAAADQSLILRKASLAMPHGGGKRIEGDSESYEILRHWIEAGVASPAPAASKLVELHVTPNEIVAEPGAAHWLRVQARWQDGRTRDVTRWALFDSRDDAVAHAASDGSVTARGTGRTAITVRYAGHVASLTVTVPYGSAPDPSWPAPETEIDRRIADEWTKMRLGPAAIANDAEFLRRAYLDIIGTLPRPDEIRMFLASRESDKRRRLIDQLLDRPEYVEFWSLKWSDLFRAHRRALGEKGLDSFHGWIRQALRENRPFDRLVRELLTAQGNLYGHGATAFFYVDQSAQDLAETTAQLFLGVRLQCAKCHHHPFESWSQDDYYGLAAFFAAVKRKDSGDSGRWGGMQLVRLAPGDRVIHPGTRAAVTPRALGWSPADAATDSRRQLADWIVDPTNPYFARSVVNRYWGHFFGRGLVDPVDDLRATNPASHPELLDWLAGEFVAGGFDLKRLVQTICESRTYQLACNLEAARDRDGMFFTHRIPRRLAAEVLLDAINQAAESVENFENLPPGTRAISLPDPAVASYFLDTFGRPKRTSTCECERGSRADLGQILHLANSAMIQEKIAAPAGRVHRLVSAGRAPAEIVDELYLATLSRLPSDAERATAIDLSATAASPQEGFEDLLWTLLNCGEFSFNH